MDNNPLNVKPVAPSERVSFRCTRCGACCRHLRESVPLNTLDAFRLAKHLRAQGERIDCLDSVLYALRSLSPCMNRDTPYIC